MVAPFLDPQGEIAPLHDYDVLYRGAAREGKVRIVLEGDEGAAPEAAVGGYEELCLGIDYPVLKGLRAESAENDGMDGADAGAGEHGDGQLGDHGHVDGDPVALLDPQALQDVCELVHVPVEVPVGEGPLVPGLALPDYGRLVPGVRRNMAVKAVVARVEPPPDEPLGKGRVPLEDPVPLLEPVELSRLLGPEGLPVPFRRLIDRLISDERLCLERGGRREDTLLFQKRGNRGVFRFLVIPRHFLLPFEFPRSGF